MNIVLIIFLLVLVYLVIRIYRTTHRLNKMLREIEGMVGDIKLDFPTQDWIIPKTQHPVHTIGISMGAKTLDPPRKKGVIILPPDEEEEERQRIIRENAQAGKDTPISQLRSYKEDDENE